MKNENLTASTKQAYVTPELSIFGKLEDVTMGGGQNIAADGGAAST